MHVEKLAKPKAGVSPRSSVVELATVAACNSYMCVCVVGTMDICSQLWWKKTPSSATDATPLESICSTWRDTFA